MFHRCGHTLFMAIPLVVACASYGDDVWDKIEAEYAEAQEKWHSESGVVKINPFTDMPPHPSEAFRPRVRKYAEDHAGSSDAIPALMWLMQNDMSFLPIGNSDGAAAWALDRLKEDHATDPALKDHLHSLQMAAWAAGQEPMIGFLETVAERNPDRTAKGRAQLAMAEILYEEAPGGGMMTIVHPSDRTAERTRAGKLFRSVADEFGGSEIAKTAERYLFAIENLQVGKKAPEIVGKDVDGKEIRLSAFRGKVVALNFWATWCMPCMLMIPQERALMEELADEPFTILGINLDEDAATLRRALKKEQIAWPTIYDGAPGTDGIAEQWLVRSFPTTVLIDRDGVIRHTQVPPFELDSLVRQMVSALREGPSAQTNVP